MPSRTVGPRTLYRRFDKDYERSWCHIFNVPYAKEYVPFKGSIEMAT